MKTSLRVLISRFPCAACPPIPVEEFHWIVENIDIAPRRSDPHHVTTRGAGGRDVAENLMALCRKHHDEWDAPWGGPSVMIAKYPGVRLWLEAAGRTDVLEKCVANPDQAK